MSSRGRNTVEPGFNELLYNEGLGIRNDILQPGLLKCMEQNIGISPLALR